MDYKTRCADCACLVTKNGVWLCEECFNAPCSEVDDCPEGMDESTLDNMNTLDKFKVDHGASAENKENKPKKPKTVKISDEKRELFDFLWEGISNYYENSSISIQNKAIDLVINDKSFTINLVEHRKKK